MCTALGVFAWGSVKLVVSVVCGASFTQYLKDSCRHGRCGCQCLFFRTPLGDKPQLAHHHTFTRRALMLICQRLLGREQLESNRSISAVLLFNSTGQVKAGAPSYLTQKHQVDSMSFDGGFLANYSVYGKGIVQSQFRASGFRKHPAYCASNAALSM